MTRHVLGSRVRVNLDTGGATAGDLELAWRRWPDGAESTVSGGSIVSDGGGLYHAFVLPDEVGHYRYRWTSDASDLAAEGVFDVGTDYPA